MNDLLTELAMPFPPQSISWKPGASKDNKCMALAYADLRAYQERLDAVCGLDWSVEYQPWGDGRIIAKITISYHSAMGQLVTVTRSATGEADSQDERNNMAGSVTEAMAFKRAAAMFGLGRYLYDLPSVWVDFDTQAKRISKAGQNELDSRYATWYNKKIAVADVASKDTTKMKVAA